MTTTRSAAAPISIFTAIVMAIALLFGASNGVSAADHASLVEVDRSVVGVDSWGRQIIDMTLEFQFDGDTNGLSFEFIEIDGYVSQPISPGETYTSQFVCPLVTQDEADSLYDTYSFWVMVNDDGIIEQVASAQGIFDCDATLLPELALISSDSTCDSTTGVLTRTSEIGLSPALIGWAPFPYGNPDASTSVIIGDEGHWTIVETHSSGKDLPDAYIPVGTGEYRGPPGERESGLYSPEGDLLGTSGILTNQTVVLPGEDACGTTPPPSPTPTPTASPTPEPTPTQAPETAVLGVEARYDDTKQEADTLSFELTAEAFDGTPPYAFAWRVPGVQGDVLGSTFRAAVDCQVLAGAPVAEVTVTDAAGESVTRDVALPLCAAPIASPALPNTAMPLEEARALIQSNPLMAIGGLAVLLALLMAGRLVLRPGTARRSRKAASKADSGEWSGGYYFRQPVLSPEARLARG